MCWVQMVYLLSSIIYNLYIIYIYNIYNIIYIISAILTLASLPSISPSFYPAWGVEVSAFTHHAGAVLQAAHPAIFSWMFSFETEFD